MLLVYLYCDLVALPSVVTLMLADSDFCTAFSTLHYIVEICLYCPLSYVLRWWRWYLRVMIFALHSLICTFLWRQCCWCLRTMIFALPPLICIKYLPAVKCSTYIEICLYCPLSYISYNSLVTLMYACNDFCTAFSNLHYKFC